MSGFDLNDENRHEDVGGPGDEPGDLIAGARPGTGDTSRGSADPAGGESDPSVAVHASGIDPDVAAGEPGSGSDPAISESGGPVPYADALDVGESGAPAQTLGTGAGGGLPAHAGQHRAGSGVAVGELRGRGTDVVEGDERPAGGGPAPGRMPEHGDADSAA